MKSIAISLILMLFSSQSLMAVELPQTLQKSPVVVQQPNPPPPQIMPDKPAAKAIKKIELTPAGVHALAEQKKSLDLCQVNLASETKAYQDCNAKSSPPLGFWQHPAYAIGAPVAALILGFLAASIVQH